MAGGTRLTISGSNFADSMSETGNEVFIWGVPCTVMPLHSTPNQVVCRTGYTGRYTNWVHVELYVNGVKATTCGNNCRFLYADSNTYRVENMRSGVANGDVLAFVGDLQVFGDAETERIINPSREVEAVSIKIDDPELPNRNEPLGTAGTRLRFLYNDTTNELASIKYQYNTRYVGDRKPGYFNASVTYSLESRPGDALIENRAMHYHYPSKTLYSVAIVPSVTGVSPPAGSVAGGTRITVSGNGFDDEDVSNNIVTVGGVPCAVVSVTRNTIVCDIAHDTATIAESLDASCPAPASLKSELLGDGQHWVGGRGVRARRWLSNGHSSSVWTLTDAPDHVWSMDFLADRTHDTPTATRSRVTTMFVAPAAGYYTFAITSDDNAELYMSDTDRQVAFGTDAGSDRIARESQWRNWWDVQTYKYHEEVSFPVWLETGEMRTMDFSHQQGASRGHFKVAVTVHDPALKPTTADASSFEWVWDRQEITHSRNPTKTVASVKMTVPDQDVLESSSLTVTYANKSVSVPANSTATTLVAAMEDAFLTSRAPVDPATHGQVYMWRKFEDNIAGVSRQARYHWRHDESYTGRSSVWVEHSRMRFFEVGTAESYEGDQLDMGEGNGKYDSDVFPWFCMAAKMNPNTRSNILLRRYSDVDGGGYSWMQIRLTGATFRGWVQLGEWDDWERTGEWEHHCINIDDRLDAVYGADKSHYIGGIILYNHGVDRPLTPDQWMFVDDVSVTERPVNLADSRVPRHDEVTGDHMSSVEITLDGSAPDIWIHQYLATTCGIQQTNDAGEYVMTPFEFSSDSSDVSFSEHTTAWGSPVSSGTLKIGLPGRTPAYVQYPFVDNLRTALMDTGAYAKIHAWWSGTCTWSRYHLYFNGDYMDVPDVELELLDTTPGTPVHFQETMKGGVRYTPVPGEMLREVSEDPVVAVQVNGIRSGCRPPFDDSTDAGAGGFNPLLPACEFVFDDAATPTVASVTPASGGAGTSITIAGSGFSDTTDDLTVAVGGEDCAVTAATTTSVTCTVGAVTAGAHPVVVHVAGSGYAVLDAATVDAAMQFTATLTLSGVSPATGSIAGGTEVVITGQGFPTSSDAAELATLVQIGVGEGAATDCQPVESTLTQLTCVTGAKVASADPAAVTVTVLPVCGVVPDDFSPSGGRRLEEASASGTSASLPSGYSFMDEASSPKLTTTAPATGPVVGGTIVTVTGAGFSLGAPQLTFDAVACSDVSVLDDTQLTCRTPAAPVGDVSVTLNIAGVGLAIGTATFEFQLAVDDVQPPFISLATGVSLSVTGGGVGAPEVDLQVTLPRKSTVVVDVTGPAEASLTASSSLVLSFGPGAETAPITVPTTTAADGATVVVDGAALETAVQAAFGALDGVDAGSVDVTVAAAGGGAGGAGGAGAPAPAEVTHATIVIAYRNTAADPPIAPEADSNERCVNPFFLDWDATACPVTATTLYYAYYPHRWPVAGPSPPSELGTVAYLNAVQAQCDAEAKCLGYDPKTTGACKYAMPSTSSSSAPFCGTTESATTPCWLSPWDRVRTPVFDDAGDVAGYDEYVLDDSMAGTDASLGFMFFRKFDGVELLTASVDDGSVFLASVTVATAEFSQVGDCLRTDDASNPDAAQCWWSLPADARCAVPGAHDNLYGSSITHDVLATPSMYFPLARPASPGSWWTPASFSTASTLLLGNHLVSHGELTGRSTSFTDDLVSGAVTLPAFPRYPVPEGDASRRLTSGMMGGDGSEESDDGSDDYDGSGGSDSGWDDVELPDLMSCGGNDTTCAPGSGLELTPFSPTLNAFGGVSGHVFVSADVHEYEEDILLSILSSARAPGDVDGSVGGTQGYFVAYNPTDSTWELWVGVGGTSEWTTPVRHPSQWAVVSAPATPDAWTFIGFVVRPTSATLYVNGVGHDVTFPAYNPNLARSVGDAPAPFRVGGCMIGLDDECTVDGEFHGAIQHLALFDSPISAADMARHSGAVYAAAEYQIDVVATATVSLELSGGRRLAPSASEIVAVCSKGGKACPVLAASITPIVMEVSPGVGYPGATLTITGSGLAATSTVVIGGADCGSVSVVSDTEVTCTLGLHAAGAADVLVSSVTGAAQVGAGVGFTYAPHVLASSPSTGSLLGGHTLTLTGSLLDEVSSVTLVPTPADAATATATAIECEIDPVSASSGALECVVGAGPGMGAAPSVSYTVTLSTDVMDAPAGACIGSVCDHALTDASTPVVSTVSSDAGATADGVIPVAPGAVLSFTGTGFHATTPASNVVTITDVARGVDVACTPSASTATTLSCTVDPTAMRGGQFKLAVLVDGSGLASLACTDASLCRMGFKPVLTSIGTTGTPDVSTAGGADLVVNAAGGGLHDDIAIVVGGKPCEVSSVAADGTSATCTLPAAHTTAAVGPVWSMNAFPGAGDADWAYSIDTDSWLQSTNAGTSSGGGCSDQRGTFLTTGSTDLADYTVSTTFTNADNDGVGVVARYQNADNYVTAMIDRQGGCAFVQVVRDGAVVSVSSVTGVSYSVDAATLMEASVAGNALTFSVGGAVLMADVDISAAPRTGAFGLASSYSTNVAFAATTVTVGTSSAVGPQSVALRVTPLTANTADEVWAACGTTCEITYSTGATPTTTSATLSGTTLTVTGTGFSTTAGDHAVFVGAVSCTPTGATGGTEVVCELPAGAVGAGAHDVRVDLPSTVGTGVSSAQVVQEATVTSILTASGGSTGSINGGTEIRVAGTGYDANTEVRVCGAVAPHTAGTTSSEAIMVSTPSQFHLGSEDAVGLGTAPEPEFDVFVSDAQDDGYELTSGTNRLERDSDHYIPMGDTATALAAFRFAGVGLPRGATVDTAKLVLRSATTGRCDGFTFRISAHGVDGAAPLTEIENDLGTRLSTGETTASVEWTPGLWRWRGDTQESPDLSDIVNEVVSRPGWRRGNAILFFVSVVTGSGSCNAWMYEESRDVGREGEFAARLVGTYTPPAVPTSTVTCDVDVETRSHTAVAPVGVVYPSCATSTNLALGAGVTYTGDSYDPDVGSPWLVANGLSDDFEADGAADGVLTLSLVLPSPGVPAHVEGIDLEWTLSGGFRVPAVWSLEVSADGGDTWVQVADHSAAPAGVYMSVHLQAAQATHVRLLVPGSDPASPWAMTSVDVRGCQSAVPSGSSASLTDGFTYDPSTTVTPRVTGVQRDDDASRADGSTAGGSHITITGTLFSDTAADNTVWIDGVECVVTASTTTSVSCTTGATSVLNGGPKFVTVNVAGLGSSVPGDGEGDSAVFAYIDRWSSPTTWGYDEDGDLWGPPTGCGDWATLEGKKCRDSIHIPKGQVVLLDTSPGRFYLILVEGTLLFDRTDIELDATYILIRGGVMEVGTEHAPFEQQATITMYGHPKTLELPTFGAKGIFVYRGRLDMHGKFTSKSWTRLASTATIGATSMTLQEPVDWEVGHRVAIAPTDWMFEHAETVTLTSVSGDGLTLGFTPALQWEHLGEDRVIDGDTVTMRAEVGLLSRNIVFQGDDDSNACIEVSTPAKFSCAQFGAQIMLHSPGDDSLIGRIEGVELRNVGQASRLGRYAIHFHMIGNVFQSYVRDCTVHGSHNRGIAIHGVHYLRVQRNVFLHTKGHAVFVEDGIETFNVIEGNLAMVSLPSQSLLNTDQTPASFWIVNANNYVRGNVAAGSKNYGFWYRPELSLTGTSANTPGVCPTGIPLLMFEDNVAHSNGKYGLRIFDIWIPRSDPNGCSGEPETAYMRRLLSYRNHQNGVTATSIGQITFEDFIVADNLAAGFEFRQITSSDWESTAITGGVIIAHTGGQPVGEESDAPIQGRGVNGPISFGLVVSNTKFSNFDIDGFAAVHACAVCGRGGSPKIGQGGMDVHFEGVTWFNSPNRAMWRHNWEGIWVDRDGTYAGTAPTPAVVVPCTDLLPADGSCVETTGYGLGQAGCVCTGHNVRRVGANGMAPTSLNKQNIFLRRMSGSSVGEWVKVEHIFKPSPTHSEGYTYALTAGQAYEIKWELDTFERVDLDEFNMGIFQMAEGDNIWMSIDHWTWAFKDEIDRPLYWAGVYPGDKREVASTATILDAALSPYVLPAPDASGPGFEWHIDPHTVDEETGAPVNYGGYLTWLASGCAGSCRRDVALEVHPCPAAGCWPPPPPPPEPEPEDETVAWSDPATWDSLQDHLGHPLNFVSDEGALLVGQTWAGDIPSAGDNVWIPSWKSVRIDVLPPKLGHVVVEGRLVFSKLVDVDALVLAADYIHIKGDGVLQAGSSSSPWPADKKAVIRLHGHRHSGKLNLGNPTVTRVGAKAMGVFGQLKLYAETPATLCGSLTTTVAAGATSLTVNGDLTGWLPGQSIVVTPTGYEPFEAEEVVIAAAGVTVNDVGGGSFTTTVPLASPLAFKHASIAETHGSRSAELRARVCLLSRSIVIEGAEDVDPESPYPGETTGFGVEVGDHYEGQEFGGKILVGKLYEKFDWSWELAADGSFVQGPGFRRIHSGSAEIEGVEFKHMGQNGGDFDHAIRFDGVKGSETRSFVSRSALHGGFNSAISTSRSTGIDITDNVVFRTVNSGIVLDSTADVVVSNNVVTLNIFFGSYLSNIFASEEFYTIAGIQAEGSVAVIMNNVVAGAERAAYRLSGRPCDAGAFDPAPADGSPVDTSANVFMGNEAHSALIGLFVMTGTTCDVFSDFTAWRIYDLGIFADHVTSSLTFEGATVADSTVGFMLHLMGPGSLSHVRVDKRIKLHDVLAIGATADYDCSLKTGVKSNTMCKAKKSHCFPAGMDTSALWYPIFNSAANHAPNISPWWGIGHYPAIGGQTQLDGVTFANYNNEAGCGRTVKFNAFDTNPAMFDAVHEVTTANVEWVNVAEASKFQIRPPKAKQINQDDCVDMDCDGFKHILVTDTDGTLLDGEPGSVTARAEYFSPNAWGATLPAPQMFTPDGILLAEEDILPNGYGMPRPGCTEISDWNAWKCKASDVKHTQLIIESMDIDTEIRRLSPASLNVGGYNDLFNGPADHGWCFGYTCLKRISTFFVVAAVGESHELFFSGTPPKHLRFHLVNADPDESIVLSTFYTTPQRIQAVVTDTAEVVEDLNMLDGKFKSWLVARGEHPPNNPEGGWTNQVPTVFDNHGTNSFDRVTRMMSVTLKGDRPLDLVVTPTVQVSFSLAISVEDFFEQEDGFLDSVAFVLQIPKDRIFVVSVVPGSVDLDLEIAPPAKFGFAELDVEVKENAGTATLTIGREDNVYGNLTVGYNVTVSGTATPGVHFTPATGTVDFASQQITAAVEIPITTDGLYTASPISIQVELFNVTTEGESTYDLDLANSIATVTLLNVDPPTPEAPDAGATNSTALTVEWDVPAWTSPDAASAITRAEVQVADAHTWTTAFLTNQADVLTDGGSADFTHSVGVYTTHVFRMRVGSTSVWSEWSANSSAVTSPPMCGDGVRQGDEGCDVGAVSGTGCTSCVVNVGFSCTGMTPDTCEAGCNDGVKAGDEECDDGGNVDDDGCSGSCRIESGWTCVGANSDDCSTTCGDGIIAGSEVCDDAGVSGGCAGDCLSVTAGWTCAGTDTSVCQSCGNGLLEGTEVCDDMNGSSGDGCSSTCGLEAGFVCTRVTSPEMKDDCVGGPVPAVTAPSTSDIRVDGVTVTWDAADGLGLNITSYIIEAEEDGGAWAVAPGAGALAPSDVVTSGDASVFSHHVTNLTAATRYRFRVAGVTTAGTGAAGPTSVLTTTLEPPATSVDSVTDDLVDGADELGVEVEELEIVPPAPEPTPPPVVEEITAEEAEEILEGNPDAFNKTGVEPPPEASPSAAPAPVLLGKGIFVSPNVTATAGNASVFITVDRTSGTFTEVGVSWQLVAADADEAVAIDARATPATDGTDFISSSGTLTYASGVEAASFTVSLPLPSTPLWYLARVARLELVNATGGGAILPPGVGYVTILSAHAAPVISVSAPATVNEFAGVVPVTVTRSVNTVGACSVDYTVTGPAGYVTVEGGWNGTVSFADGETTKVINVTVVSDEPMDVTATRTFTVALDESSVVGAEVDSAAATASTDVEYVACGVVAGYDCPQLTFDVTETTVTEARDAFNVTAVLRRTGAMSRSVEVDVAAAFAPSTSSYLTSFGSVFTAGMPSTTVSFPADSSVAHYFVFTVSPDGLDTTMTRSVSLTLANMTMGALAATPSYVLNVDFESCGVVSDCSTAGASYKAVRSSLQLVGVSAADFSNSTALQDEFKAAYADALNAATNGDVVVTADAVEIESIEAGPTVSDSRRRRLSAPSTVVTTRVTMPGTTSATSTSQAAAAATAAQSSSFASAVGAGVSGVTSAAVTGPAPETVDAAAAGAAPPAPSPSPAPIGSSDSNTGVVVAVAIGVSLVVVASLAFVYYVFVRNPGKKKARTEPYDSPVKDTIQDLEGDEAKPSVDTRPRMHDWRCTECGFKNVARSTQCQVCRADGSPLPPVKVPSQRNTPTNAAAAAGAAGSKLFTRSPSPSPAKVSKDLRIESSDV